VARRTALITGASAGLGQGFAEALAGEGYNLVLVARRLDRLETLAAGLQDRHGIHTQCLMADLEDPEAPSMIHAATQATGTEIDFLINNAGRGGPHLLEDRDWSAHARYFELMMISAAHLCHLYAPAMAERGFGRIINVASMAARLPRAGGCNYGPSKAYLVALSEELQLTLGRRGVHVCGLCPGFTHTDFHNDGDLAAMKASSPRWLWYDADTVVREGLAAVERGRSVYATGRLYRWLDPLLQLGWIRRAIRMQAAQ